MEKSSNKLVDLSVAFAIEILNLVKYLKSQHETIICNQIGRAGTCIGAKKMKPSGFASWLALSAVASGEGGSAASWHNVPLHTAKPCFIKA